MAKRKLRRAKKRCPDCMEADLFIKKENNNSNGVIYSQEFYVCLECGYKEPLKKYRRNNKKDDYDDEYW